MPDTIVSTLEYKSAIWLQQFKNVVTHFKLDAKGYGFELSVGATVDYIGSRGISHLQQQLTMS